MANKQLTKQEVRKSFLALLSTRKLYSMAKRMGCRDSDDADDLVQEAILRTLEKGMLEKYDPSRMKFDSFIYRIMHSVYIDLFRAKFKRISFLERDNLQKSGYLPEVNFTQLLGPDQDSGQVFPSDSDLVSEQILRSESLKEVALNLRRNQLVFGSPLRTPLGVRQLSHSVVWELFNQGYTVKDISGFFFVKEERVILLLEEVFNVVCDYMEDTI